MQVTRIVGGLILSSAVIVHSQPAAPAQSVPPTQSQSPGAPVIVATPNAAPANGTAAQAAPVAGQNNAQVIVVNTRTISLQEAIDMALQHNLDVQIQRYLPDIARFDLQGAWGAYDPTLFASGQHNYSLSPGQFDPYQNITFQGSETESDSFNTGLSGLLPWGLSYSVTANANDTYGNRPSAIPPGFEISTANAAVSQLRQPLLKNFWIDASRANIQISRNRLKYSELTLRQQLMSTVTAVEQAYYNLIFTRENVKVQETALQLAERLLWENRKKIEVGQLAPLDEKQAESQAAASRADLLAANRSLDVQENVLKNLITDNFSSLHSVRLIPAENLIAVPPILNLQDSWDKATQNRPDLLQARLDVERDDINLRYTRNQLFPQLDLIGQYGYAGGNVREFSGAIGQVRDRSNPFWYYGASISYPLGNRTARSNYKISKVQKAQNELILKQREQAVLVQVDDAVKLVQTDYERIDATKKAREFAQAALDAEQKKLENGKSTSFLVLQYQRDLTAAKFSEVQALADYNNALSQLALSEGMTLQRHRLNVQVK